MKIGMLLPSLLAAGRFQERIFAPKPLLISLADGLVDHGHEVYVYSSSDLETKAKLIGGDKILEESDFPSVKVRFEDEKLREEMFYRINYAEYEADLTSKAFDHAQALKLDIMHSYHDFLAHYFARLVPHIPTVYTLHDPVCAANTIEGWRFDQFRNDLYIAISHYQARRYMEKVRIEDIIYHGVDVGTFPFSPTSKDYLGFIGRFVVEKGVEDAILAAKQAGLVLHMASSGNYLNTPYFREKIKPHIDNKQIIATGFMDRQKLSAWVQQAKMILVPSVFEEPFGMVLIEAMACGTPVVAYGRGSVPEVVVDGVTGFVVEPEKVSERVRPSGSLRSDPNRWIVKKTGIEGLCEAVEKIYNMPKEEYKKMRVACRKHVEEKFTVEKMVAGHEMVYRKILSRK